jgi:PAS domain S-box-containing protein
VLVIDHEGRVTAVNGAARHIWPDRNLALIGAPLVSLFEFEVHSRDPYFQATQWESLVVIAGSRETDLRVATPEGSSRPVRLRLDPLAESPRTFLATVQPPAAPAAAVAAASDGHAAFELLANHAGFGFFDLDLVTERVRFSPAWKKLLGFTATEMPATLETWHDLIHPDDSAGAPDRIGRKLPPGTHAFNVEFRLQHQLGHWVWVQCAGVQVVGTGGRLARVVGIHLDITERKELEDALVASDARLQDLTATGPLAAFEIDFVQGSTWYSAAFERLLGYGAGELPRDAEGFGVVLPEDEVAGGTAAWWYGRAPGQATFAEPVLLRLRDGRTLSALLGANRSLSRKRDLQRVAGFVCPLPAHLTQPGALPATLTETGFHTLAEAILITDARRRILFANTAAARLLRTEASALRGQPVGDVFHLVDRQSLRPADDPVDAALAAVGPLPLHSDAALAPASGQEAPVPVVWTARAALGPDGAPRGVVIVFRNPEEMSLTPEELVRANRFETLGQLAGEIAHDINNLLTTVLGAISLGRDNRDFSGIADAEQACLTAKSLTKQLLAFAKGGGGTQSVCPARGILEDAIRMGGAGSTAEIALRVADDTSPVQADRSQLLQVFQNLVINALQAMPPPPHRPQVQVSAGNTTLAENQVPGLAAGDYVEIEVRDNGSGIQPEHVGRIFDPFFTTKKHGTGLGLATVLSIVRQHGGQIGLDTQVGVGTAFTVYLPKADRPAEVQARRAASLRFGTGRILFMDDDPSISTLTGRMLESLDYKYDLAKDGEEALALYRRYLNIGRPYDAVILDLSVVGAMGGEACFAELRKLDPDVRAIVASGYDNEDIARKFLEQGFCGYLTKPYRVADLGKVLKAVLE